jgi:hypothetical protein
MNDVLAKHAASSRVRVFVIWEHVMSSDSEVPSADTLARVGVAGTQQFWDPGRVVSKAFGEKDEASIVWDCVYIYVPGTRWTGQAPPAHRFTDRPVVDVVEAFEKALVETIKAIQ